MCIPYSPGSHRPFNFCHVLLPLVRVLAWSLQGCCRFSHVLSRFSQQAGVYGSRFVALNHVASQRVTVLKIFLGGEVYVTGELSFCPATLQHQQGSQVTFQGITVVASRPECLCSFLLVVRRRPAHWTSSLQLPGTRLCSSSAWSTSFTGTLLLNRRLWSMTAASMMSHTVVKLKFIYRTYRKYPYSAHYK